MAPSYYVIELTGRWLAILLAALALVMVVAFAFGYGAAWSVLSGRPVSEPDRVAMGVATPTPTPAEVVIAATPAAPTPDIRPSATWTPTPVPATPAPKPEPTRAPVAADDSFWVQVLASGNASAMNEARSRLAELGFPRDHQSVTRGPGPGGNELLKLRVGPFPDRASADRVVERMTASGFSGAWVVAP
jgi:cell division septation protein DedD